MLRISIGTLRHQALPPPLPLFKFVLSSSILVSFILIYPPYPKLSPPHLISSFLISPHLTFFLSSFLTASLITASHHISSTLQTVEPTEISLDSFSQFSSSLPLKPLPLQFAVNNRIMTIVTCLVVTVPSLSYLLFKLYSRQ